MNKLPVIIFGANRIGKTALEIFKSHNIIVYCFLDDDESLHNQEIQEVLVMGSTDNETLTNLLGETCNAFIATDELALRLRIAQKVERKYKKMPVNAIHQSVVVASDANIGHGNLIDAGAVISTGVKIGRYCLIHAGAIIAADAQIGDFVQIGAGAIIGEGAKIEDKVFVGSGANIIAGVKVEEQARIGAGSIVMRNVEESQTVFGNPAAPIK
ncbi:MAG: NeuD/PglB/VioB family sugar acetyltransferase [Bernardetiaceae bacterium]|nr:NeuD/PglB/VioB family sugar acetyltransferase [Bernardetiaceae bacterium]